MASVCPGANRAGPDLLDPRRAKARGDASCRPFAAAQKSDPRLSRGHPQSGVFMSKELVISAASHERRVAILEEGQLVEIYIEREKEFALVGSIYKGRVTRVLPGMQSAFVDIGLDGDAFLYVSDVFENLEDYDHGHPHTDQPAAAPAFSPAYSPSNAVEALPGETLAHAASSHEQEEDHARQARGEETAHESFDHEASHEELSDHDSPSHSEQPGVVEDHATDDEIHGAHAAEVHEESHAGHPEERQPD